MYFGKTGSASMLSVAKTVLATFEKYCLKAKNWPIVATEGMYHNVDGTCNYCVNK